MSTTVGVVADDDSRSWGSDGVAGPVTPGGAVTPAVTSVAVDLVGTADPRDLDRTADGPGAGLVGAVDALEDVSREPVRTHAARYHDVHTLLQDALSATDRPATDRSGS